MGWEFNCIEDMVRAARSAQTSAEQRNAFLMGMNKASTMMGRLQGSLFNVDNQVRQMYRMEERCETVIANLPKPYHCGVDLPIAKSRRKTPPVYFTPFILGNALEACRTECEEGTFNEYMAEQEKSAGAGFGVDFDNVFWHGATDVGQKGFTSLYGNLFYDMAEGGNCYSDLCEASPNQMVNTFRSMVRGLNNAHIVMGEAAMEAIAYRDMSTTGDTCGNIWTCVMDLMRQTGLNITFIVDPAFDRITGLFPNDPDKTGSVMWAYDPEFIRMGVQSNEDLGCPFAESSDIMTSARFMHFSGPQIRRYGSSRFFMNFMGCDTASCFDKHYDECGGPPSLILPPPPFVESMGEEKKAA